MGVRTKEVGLLRWEGWPKGSELLRNNEVVHPPRNPRPSRLWPSPRRKSVLPPAHARAPILRVVRHWVTMRSC